MDISSSIIHGILKEKDESGPDSTTITPRRNLLPLDDRLKRLGDDILVLYGRLSNGYGVLGDDTTIHKFPELLSEYEKNETNLISLSNEATKLIAAEMSSSLFTTTSYPIFIRYTNQDRDWILIAMLKIKDGIGIDTNTLDLNDSLFFDISNLREAARIDIAKWKANDQPYLSFIKRGAGSEGDSSAYLRKALSCTDYTDSKHHTSLLLETLEQYCQEKEFDAEKNQAIKARVYEHCKEMKDQGRPVNLIALSAFIDPEDPEAFVSYTREKEVPINETFSPHPATYRKLQRLSKKFGTISVGFDVDDIFNERVYFDEDNGNLVIRNPPKDLTDKIKKAKGLNVENDDEDD